MGRLTTRQGWISAFANCAPFIAIVLVVGVTPLWGACVSDVVIVATDRDTAPSLAGYELAGYWDVAGAGEGTPVGGQKTTGSWNMGLFYKTDNTPANCIKSLCLEATDYSDAGPGYTGYSRLGMWDVDSGGGYGLCGVNANWPHTQGGAPVPSTGSYMMGLYKPTAPDQEKNQVIEALHLTASNGSGPAVPPAGYQVLGYWDVDRGGGYGAKDRSTGSYMMTLSVQFSAPAVPPPPTGAGAGMNQMTVTTLPDMGRCVKDISLYPSNCPDASCAVKVFGSQRLVGFWDVDGGGADGYPGHVQSSPGQYAYMTSLFVDYNDHPATAADCLEDVTLTVGNSNDPPQVTGYELRGKWDVAGRGLTYEPDREGDYAMGLWAKKGSQSSGEVLRDVGILASDVGDLKKPGARSSDVFNLYDLRGQWDADRGGAVDSLGKPGSYMTGLFIARSAADAPTELIANGIWTRIATIVSGEVEQQVQVGVQHEQGKDVGHEFGAIVEQTLKVGNESSFVQSETKVGASYNYSTNLSSVLSSQAMTSTTVTCSIRDGLSRIDLWQWQVPIEWPCTRGGKCNSTAFTAAYVCMGASGEFTEDQLTVTRPKCSPECCTGPNCQVCANYPQCRPL